MKKTMYIIYFNGNGYLSNDNKYIFTSDINEAMLFWSIEDARRNISNYARGGKIVTVEVSMNVISEQILEPRVTIEDEGNN
jgi:hypothetical protein